MNRHWTTMTAGLLLIAVTALPLTAHADHREHGRHRDGPAALHRFGDPERLLRHLAKALELDETQEQNVSNIVAAARPETESLKERTRENFAAMHGLDPATGDYATALQNLATENGRLATEATLLYGRLRAEIVAELTPGQRQQLAQHEEQMRRHFEERERRRPE